MRGDFLVKNILDGGFFALDKKTMESLVSLASGDIPKASNIDIEVSDGNVVYQTIGSTAIISVCGGMYKRDMSAYCMNIVSYPAILSAINKAESDTNIDTTFFRVDTGGGHIDGVDEVQEAIKNSKNKTITLFENIGASGGIWIFMASDEVYATETTMLGSIGVVASYRNTDGDDKETIEITSVNAPNKRCNLDDDCKKEMQTQLDGYESIFFSRVEANTGFDKEKIKRVFNNGGVIFASEAKKESFIDDVTTFDAILGKIQNKNTIDDSVINKQENNLIDFKDLTKDSYAALLTEHSATIDANDKSIVALEEKVTKLTAGKAEDDKTISAFAAKKEEIIKIASMAYDKSANKETLISMLSADDEASAALILVSGMSSDGAFGADTGTMDVKKEDEPKAWGNIKKMKGSK